MGNLAKIQGEGCPRLYKTDDVYTRHDPVQLMTPCHTTVDKMRII